MGCGLIQRLYAFDSVLLESAAAAVAAVAAAAAAAFAAVSSLRCPGAVRAASNGQDGRLCCC